MIDEGTTSGAPAPSPREGLAAQLRQLEEFVARAESQDGELPPEGMEMIARLREIMQALDGLSASFGEELLPAKEAPAHEPHAPERP